MASGYIKAMVADSSKAYEGELAGEAKTAAKNTNIGIKHI